MTLSTKLSEDITDAIMTASNGSINGALEKRSEIVDGFISFYYDIIEILIGARKKLEDDGADVLNDALLKISKEFKGQ